MVTIWWSEEDAEFVAKDDSRPGCNALGISEIAALKQLQFARDAWDEAKGYADAVLDDAIDRLTK